MLDDRALAHLQIAMMVKLRRNESFAFTLTASHMPSGLGSCTLWISSQIPLIFEFHDPRARTAINAHWVDALVAEASGVDGLRLVPEPESTRSPCATPATSTPPT